MDLQTYQSNDPIAWCPGCGNFGILTALKKALLNLDLPPKDVLLVSGIGQAAKLPHYIKSNCFNGLHGRALPAAAGAKIANPALTVIVTTGDGDCYGEGGNHFIHNIRRNVDITVIVHNNQIYGLTKGQASPTTDTGFTTNMQPNGVVLEPFHGVAVAIALGAGFVARGYSGHSDALSDLIVKGVRHRGFSLIEVLQPCVTFNHRNTYRWYSERLYRLEDEKDYDPRNKMRAVGKAFEWGDKIPEGVFYEEIKDDYAQKTGLADRPHLVDETVNAGEIFKELIDVFI
ncbi:MAG: 2-oxoacid:ferredoxin oxidoreductase subunit beta [Candidatus Omnitrophota bacterium]